MYKNITDYCTDLSIACEYFEKAALKNYAAAQGP
jgi:hypothetical protein